MFKNDMTVCLGNICKSLFARFYLKHHQSELNAFSSGLDALSVNPTDPDMVKLSKKYFT